MKQFQQPLISILIANYNNSRYLKRCINSCLKQTYKNFEIIVFDDASTDDSIKRLKKFNDIESRRKNSKERLEKIFLENIENKLSNKDDNNFKNDNIIVIDTDRKVH